MRVRDCDVCVMRGRFEVLELGIDEVCWACGGRGWLSLWGRLRVWNATHKRGSFPARAKCWLLKHDWQKIEFISYCSRCRAVFDTQWEEKSEAPSRY